MCNNFKKTPLILQVMINYLGQGRQSLLCEDESRFGLKTLLSRVILFWALNP